MTRRVSDMTPEQHAQHLATRKAKRKRYRERYPERFKAVKKLSKQRTRDQMSDGYIRQQLGVKNAPQELLEVKRAHLKLRRQLRTMK